MFLIRLVALFASTGALYAGIAAWAVPRLSGGRAERVVAVVLLALFVQIALLRVLGAATLLTGPAVVMSSFGAAAGFFWAATRRGPAAWLSAARASLGGDAPWSARPSEAGLEIASIAALLATFGLLALQAWIYRSTAWDALWYHVVMTHEYVLRESTSWFETPIVYAQGYPNGVELLSAGTCAVTRTTELDDTGQLAFGVAGAALVTAWARRAGARSELALAAAVVFVAMPPVFLSMSSDLNDVAYAVAFAATLFFLAVAGDSPLRSWMVLVSAGLMLAIKGSALVQLPLLAPWLVRDQLRGAKRDGHPILSTLARLGLLVWVGLYRAIDNTIHTGNPAWPMLTRLPALGLELAGPIDPREVRWNGMHGLDAYFFTGEGDFQRMVTSWYDQSPIYEPNVWSGGFGAVHAFVGLPLLAIGLLVGWRAPRAARRPLAFVYVLFAIGLTGTTPWIPRFILAAAIASAIGLAAISARLGRRLGRVIMTACMIAALGVLSVAAPRGLFVWRDYGFVDVWRMSRAERAHLRVLNLWPSTLAQERDETFTSGDAVAFDSYTQLVGSMYPWDYGSRLVWVEADGTFADYEAALRRAGARWVDLASVRRHREQLVRRGATILSTFGDEAVLDLRTIPASPASP